MSSPLIHSSQDHVISFSLSHGVKVNSSHSICIISSNKVVLSLLLSVPFHVISKVSLNIHIYIILFCLIWSQCDFYAYILCMLSLASRTWWASVQLNLHGKQWNGSEQSENPPSVKTWRTYHSTVSKPPSFTLPVSWAVFHPPPPPLCLFMHLMCSPTCLL